MTNLDKRRYSINISFSTISVVINVLVGMWFTAILTRSLGVENFGLISITAALTTAIGVFTGSMNGALNRFLTVEIAKRDDFRANVIFNSAFFSILSIALFLLPVITLIAWFSPQLFDIENNINYVRGLVFFTLVSTLVLSIMTVFTVSNFAKNRFDLLSGLQTGTVLMRVISVLSFFAVLGVNILSVGFGRLLSATIMLVAAIAVWKQITPLLHVNRKMVQASAIRELFTMGLWVGLDSIGMLLLLQINTMAAGKFLGVATAGFFGLYLAVMLSLTTFGSALSAPIQPEIYAIHATLGQDEVDDVLYSGIRITLAIMALLTAFLIGFREQVVNLWLGPNYGVVANLLLVGVPWVAFSVSLTPLVTTLNAQKKTRWVALSTVIAGIGNLITIIVLLWIGWFNVYTIALSSGIWRSIKMALLLWADKGHLGLSGKIYLHQLLYFVAMTTAPLLVVLFWGRGKSSDILIAMLLLGITMVVAWLLSTLWVLRPSDIERVIGSRWSRTWFGRGYRSFYAWKVKVFSRRTQSTYRWY